MGSTNLYEVLRSIALVSRDSDTPLNVLVLTDGHFKHEKEVFSLLHDHISTMRVFSCGLGDDVHRHNLRQVSKISGGQCEIFPSKCNYRVRVSKQIARAMLPALGDIQVEWKEAGDVVQSPSVIESIFNNERTIIYALMNNKCVEAKLTATLGRTKFSTSVRCGHMSITKGLTLHRLAARSVIKGWDDGFFDGDAIRSEIIKSQRKQNIVDLSCEYSIVTKLTSFIAVEDRSPSGSKKGVAQTMQDVSGPIKIDELSYMEWKQQAANTGADALENNSMFRFISDELVLTD